MEIYGLDSLRSFVQRELFSAMRLGILGHVGEPRPFGGTIILIRDPKSGVTLGMIYPCLI